MQHFQIISKVEFDWTKHGLSSIFPFKDNLVISFWYNYEEKYILKIAENDFEKIVIENCDIFNLPKSELRLVKLGNQFAIIYKLRKLYFLDDNFQIKNVVEIQTEDNNRYSEFSTNFDIGIGENNEIPLILCCGLDDYYTYYGYLYYDTYLQKAEIKKIFVFETNFFPKTNSDKLPFIKHLLLKDELLYGFIEGSQRTKYRGQNYSCLFKSNKDGTDGIKLFEEDYSFIQDDKRRGKVANFSYSKEYCIISPLYEQKEYDSWRGKQKIYSISDNELLEITLPKGYSKLKIFDHFNNIFWFKEFDKKKLVMSIYRAEKLRPT